MNEIDDKTCGQIARDNCAKWERVALQHFARAVAGAALMLIDADEIDARADDMAPEAESALTAEIMRQAGSRERAAQAMGRLADVIDGMLDNNTMNGV